MHADSDSAPGSVRLPAVVRGSTLSVRASKRKVLPPGLETERQSWLPLQEQPKFSGKSPRRRKRWTLPGLRGDTAGPASGTVTATAGWGMGRESPCFPSGRARNQGHLAQGADPALELTGWNPAPAPPRATPPSEGRAPPPASPAQVTGSSSLFYVAQRPSHPPQESAQHPLAFCAGNDVPFPGRKPGSRSPWPPNHGCDCDGGRGKP